MGFTSYAVAGTYVSIDDLFESSLGYYREDLLIDSARKNEVLIRDLARRFLEGEQLLWLFFSLRQGGVYANEICFRSESLSSFGTLKSLFKLLFFSYDNYSAIFFSFISPGVSSIRITVSLIDLLLS